MQKSEQSCTIINCTTYRRHLLRLTRRLCLLYHSPIGFGGQVRCFCHLYFFGRTIGILFQLLVDAFEHELTFGGFHLSTVPALGFLSTDPSTIRQCSDKNLVSQDPPPKSEEEKTTIISPHHRTRMVYCVRISVVVPQKDRAHHP
jgi:hypothetical protein